MSYYNRLSNCVLESLESLNSNARLDWPFGLLWPSSALEVSPVASSDSRSISSSSFRLRWSMMPLPMESPKTLIVVRNLHKDRRSKALKHSIAAILDRKPTYNIFWILITLVPTIQDIFCSPWIYKKLLRYTYLSRSQSTLRIKAASVAGRPTVLSTIIKVTRPAWGIPAAPILANVAFLNARQAHFWLVSRTRTF